MKVIDVSVIVLTYNQEKMVGNTINSILNQVTQFSYELIIADDCSSDKTRDVLNKFKKENIDKIKLLYNDHNLGVVNNYFNAVKYCCGNYIMVCAGDDWWKENKIQMQVKYLNEHREIGMIYGNATLFDDRKKLLTSESIGKKTESYKELYKYNGITAVTVCMRRVDVMEYIIDINPIKQKWLIEDYPMWLWFSINRKIRYIDNNLAVYRYVDDSISHSKDINKKIEFEQSVYEIQNFFNQKYELGIKNIEKYHHKQLAQIYLKFNQFNAYRHEIILSNDRGKYLKFILSFVPSYKKFLKIRYQLLCKVRSKKKFIKNNER